MLFINISADKIYIAYQRKEYLLERNGIENELGSTLLKLYKKNPFKKLRVLNGPWWFTNIRVGALCINMLNVLHNKKIDIYSCTKPMLYSYAHKEWILPQKWIIYIGQQKNVRLYNTITDSYETIKKDEIPEGEIFYDVVYEKEYFTSEDKIEIRIQEETMMLSYKNKTIPITPQDLWCKWEKEIQAEYMIQPIIGSQWQ